MRRGLLRSLSGALSAVAFAVGVASPVQWCPCPTHGASVTAHVAHAHAHADMPMPSTDGGTQAATSHAGHNDPGSPHAAHQCTCPGCCCATTPVALLEYAPRTTFEFPVTARADVAVPDDTVELAESPQLSLPFANAPPAALSTLPSAAQQTT